MLSAFDIDGPGAVVAKPASWAEVRALKGRCVVDRRSPCGMRIGPRRCGPTLRWSQVSEEDGTSPTDPGIGGSIGAMVLVRHGISGLRDLDITGEGMRKPALRSRNYLRTSES